ncbi:transposase [Micromonospora echinofusca]|uniref:IS110 family transposase n=1 Tax=Micromonospora echinofusca TaxID=47858 RepID=UPI0033301872
MEGCQGSGRHIATRLLAEGEQVVDVPPKLSARARVFATGQGRTTDATDAHCIALVGTRMAGLRPVVNDEQLALLRILVDRRRSLGEDHTRVVPQLHQLLSDVVYRCMISDAVATAAGPGGQRGTATGSSVTDSHPPAGSSEKSLPGPAETQDELPSRLCLDTEGSHDSALPSVPNAGEIPHYPGEPGCPPRRPLHVPQSDCVDLPPVTQDTHAVGHPDPCSPPLRQPRSTAADRPSASLSGKIHSRDRSGRRLRSDARPIQTSRHANDLDGSDHRHGPC